MVPCIMPWQSAFDSLQAAIPHLRALRHDLHAHPELGLAELRTQAVARDWLRQLGYEVEDCAGTGLIVDTRPGVTPTIALRADLDALPMEETTDLPYRSVHPGVAHKCGHDGHTAILLGVATALAEPRASIAGNVRLLFQPDEEGRGTGGAQMMLGAGALDGVREVYGLHNWPGFPKGEVRVSAGTVMAEIHDLTLRIRGRGGHGSEPQFCRDPIVAGAYLVTALQTVVSCGLGHRGGAVVTLGTFRAGTANNVIPESAELTGSIRSFDPAVRDRVLERVREIAAGTAIAHGVAIEVDLGDGYPMLVNDPDCCAVVERAARVVVGADRVSGQGLPLGASEDFARFTQTVPGAYFFLGAGRPDTETPGCHHPDFDFDDDLIERGVRMFLGIVEDRLAAL